jgi:diaminohydroxyphosphoribosylaminopyrimidine deaminase/5-amino-6-(5-phosphoribosylamino)uracil reductase
MQNPREKFSVFAQRAEPRYSSPVDTHKMDDRFMRMAIREARKGEGQTSPNPMVGALLVAGNRVLSRGYHQCFGGPHAEVRCLSGIRAALPAGVTLYVTLEPCSTVGKTGRCTDAIIRAGVSRVVVGAVDPNPAHRGRGLQALERAGIIVRSGVLEPVCREMNEAFNKWIVSRRPFVIAKCGMSLDGRLTQRPGHGRWITSSAARRDAQKLRAQADAIIVGAETIRRDDPRLTVRGVKNAKQPWRVILTKSAKLPASSRVFRDRGKDRTHVYHNKSLRAVLADLGRKNIVCAVIEGGGDILGQALDGGLIDKVQIYLGAMFTGGPVIAFGGRGAASTQAATQLKRISYKRIGNDLRVIGYVGSEATAEGE